MGSVKCLALDLGSGRDLRWGKVEPCVRLHAGSGACLGFSLFHSLPPLKKIQRLIVTWGHGCVLSGLAFLEASGRPVVGP